MIPTLTTERLVLRAPEVADFTPFASHYMSPRSSYEGGPHSREGAWKEFATAAAGWLLRGYGSLSVTEAGSGAYLGEVGIYHLATYPAPEIGWMVLPEFQGRGLGKAATAALIDRARADRRWGAIHAFPGVTNAPSNGICRSLGFTLLETRDIEFEDRTITANHWRLDPAPAHQG